MGNTDAGADPVAAMPSRAWPWIVMPLLLCAAGVLGSLWLSMGMGLKACPLCLYQRTFVMGAGGVLLIGLFTQLRNSPLLPLLALPAALGGFGVAVFHVSLEAAGILECPAGIFGLGSAPVQSLIVFILLVVALTAGATRGRNGKGTGKTALVVACVTGLLFALGTVRSAPPMPAAPEAPYEAPLEVCRPPYVPQS